MASKTPRLTPFRKAVLTRARKLIKQKWTTGSWIALVDYEGGYSKYRGGQEGRLTAPLSKISGMCAMGGIEKALYLELGKPKYTGEGALGFGERFDREYCALQSRLDWATRKSDYVDFLGYEFESVIALNDSPLGGKEAVLDVYDIALGLAR